MTIRKHFLVTTIPFITIAFLFIGFIIEQQYLKLLIKTSGNYADMIVNQTNRLATTRCNEYEDSLLNDLLNWQLFNNYLNSDTTSDYTNIREVRSFTNTRNTGASPIEDIYLFNLNHELFYFNPRTQNSTLSKDISSVLDLAEECWKNTTSVAKWYSIDEKSPNIYLSRKIYSPVTLQPQGVMIVSIARSNFQKLYQIMENSHQGNIFIFTEDNHMLTGNADLIPILYACKEKSSQDLCLVNSIRYVFRKYTNPENGWITYFLLSEKELLAESIPIRVKIYILTTIFLFIVITAIVFSSRQVTNDLKAFGNALKKNCTTTYPPIPDNFHSKEVQELQNIYNQIAVSLQKISEDLLEQQRISEEARYLALQAEYQQLCSMINPHFIYNAMDSINSLAKLNHQNDISYLCTSLARLMRASLSQKKRYISLEQELHYLQDYLNIQKYVLGGTLEIVYDLFEELNNILIPPLLLQPIAENCFVHGFSASEIAIIFVSTHLELYKEKSCLIIKISDNGCGMSTTRIKEIYDASQQPLQNNSHLGLVGSIRRMQLLYPSPYGIHVQSVLQQGTTVTIILPVNKGDENI